MERPALPSRRLAIVTVAVLALFSVGFTWAAIDDYTSSTIMPKGASVGGVSVGGLAYSAAVKVVEDRVEAPMLTTMKVDVDGSRITLDPSTFIKVDVKAMLEKAAQAREDSTLPERVWQRLTGATVGHNVSSIVSVDTTSVVAWVKKLRRRVTTAAVDASVGVTGSTIHFGAAKAGSTIGVKTTVAALTTALRDGTKSVQIATIPLQPKITDQNLGKTILVSRSKTTLTLYNGTKIEKVYRVAVGMPKYPTPLGHFKIVRKVKLPTWYNNGAAWAASMPAYIAPGPNNPLGTRALYLNSPGIRIHGVPSSENWSIGSPASHGCMRMHRADVEDLYPRVPVGTQVFIVP
jgi:lipoprotein-anchoring transpeptidase ErfK/SrfK